MTRTSRTLSALVAVAAALSVSACISLVPKSKPATLYRFGLPLSEAAVGTATGTVGVFRTNSAFPREAAGDRILTITDGRAAYIAETRWVAPAAALWDAAVVNAFDTDPGPARLVVRGETAAADYTLRLDVRNFESRYERGPDAGPTVVIRVRAALAGREDRAQISERIFEKRIPASGNRVTAIVPAYDRAVAEILAELVDWTNENAKPV
ncbi:MAG: ABC-type transport auxiliary lipoprotein family protein [Phenylobacterium sp.]|nr:ABC-type transport auxiliary lipoprotein family protein [Phenylobacterium sp.]